jgi:SAM-dependent methyltransferase
MRLRLTARRKEFPGVKMRGVGIREVKLVPCLMRTTGSLWLIDHFFTFYLQFTQDTTHRAMFPIIYTLTGTVPGWRGEPLLKIGQSLAQQAGVADRITLLKGDVQKLESQNDEFDVVVNTFMMHIVDDPVAMLNEIERVAKPGGIILITDLRRIWLGCMVKKLRTAFTLEEATAIIKKSNLRPGRGLKGPFWWDYIV